MDYDKALALAYKMHKGQFRWDGKPAVSHPIAVASQFEVVKYKVVAVLHDVIEDTEMTIGQLEQEHGCSKEVLTALALLTRCDGDIYLDYILALKKNKIARAVKVADLLHNMSTLKRGSMRDKYMMAEYILNH